MSEAGDFRTNADITLKDLSRVEPYEAPADETPADSFGFIIVTETPYLTDATSGSLCAHVLAILWHDDTWQ